ncbi:hypothetical protein [Helicobacter cholecystus]|uniref:hypothetical protein n=1 Tax=Helicobacter cholecystus TaxID=45498 RepID=UPI0027395730|nr:hypothetical protein [Helicobacter cholecystus]
MTYNTAVYTITIFCAYAYILRHFKYPLILSASIALLCNIPLILSLSITQWLDSICGNPSLLLALLSFCSLLANFKITKDIFPTNTTLILNPRAKIFLFGFGFILFWGNINYLWGIDLFNANFYIQILYALMIVALGYLIQPYLGVLLLLSCIGYLIAGGNIFAFMMDAVLWLYISLSLLLKATLGKLYAH